MTRTDDITKPKGRLSRWRRGRLRGALRTRLIRREAAAVAGAVAVPALLAALAGFTDGVHTSATAGLLDGARAVNAGFAYTVDAPGSPETVPLLVDSGLPALQTRLGQVATGDRSAVADAVVLASSDDRVLGGYGDTVAADSSDNSTMPAALSTALAQRLGVGVGDSLDVTESTGPREFGRKRAVVVTRTFTVPSSPRDEAVVILASATDVNATRWLADPQDLAEPALADLINSGSIRLRSAEALAAEQLEDSSALAWRWLRWVPIVLLLVALFAWWGGSFLAARRWRDTADGLQALGLSAAESVHVMRSALLRPFAFTVATACAMGGAAAVLVGRWVDVIAGQEWRWGTVAWWHLTLWILAGLTCAALVSMLTVRTGQVRQPSMRTRVPAAVPALAAGAAAVSWAWLTITPGDDPGRQMPALVAAVATAVAVATGVPALAGRGEGGRARRRVASVFAAAGLPSAVAVAVVLAMAVFVSLAAHGSSVRGERSYRASQPAGSLVLDDVPSGALALVLNTWANGGSPGRASVLQRTSDVGSLIRVTSPAMARCVEGSRRSSANPVDADCADQFPTIRETLSPITSVALTGTGTVSTTGVPAPGVALADPGLIDNGQVGLLVFEAGSTTVTRTLVVAAQPDPDLGGQLPGAVLDAASTAAVDLGLIPADLVTVLLPTADRLPDDQRARLRAELQARAPSAYVTEEGGYDDGGLATTAIIVPIAAGAIAFLLIALHSLGLVRANSSTRAVLAQAGRRDRRTWTLVARSLAPFTAAAVSATVAGLAAASEADRGLTGSAVQDGGTWHLMAPAVAFLALIGAAALFGRAPAGSRPAQG